MKDTKQRIDLSQIQCFHEANKEALKDLIALIPEGREINLKELRVVRTMKAAFLALKVGNHIYLIPEFPKSLRPASHLCSMCKHCIARPSSEGGCDKVFQRENKYMESFPFIKIAAETYDASNKEVVYLGEAKKAVRTIVTSFYVLDCSRFRQDG